VTQTDEAIALHVQKGDVEQFGELIKRYEPKMTRYARKFLFQGDDVKDLVQEVFIKAYVNIQSFDTTRRFSPWLYRIAHNEFINAVKKKSRLPVFSFDFDALLPQFIAKETAESKVAQADIKRLLDTCLDKLGPKYREPLVLYYIEEMEYKEIAEILKIPVATVGVRLSRGKAMLRQIAVKLNVEYA
jgi:RNA polymerase sigma-70 factor (ECF subfamily)